MYQLNSLALNVTAMCCPGVLSRRTAKTANGLGLFGPITVITSRCQTNIGAFNIEVQHTGILPSGVRLWGGKK